MNFLRLSTHSLTLAIAVFALGDNPSFADTILESGTMGPTTTQGGSVINPSQYLGARFSTSVQVAVTAIGGHIDDFGESGLHFGAIVRLSGPNALPTGSPVDANWLATTLFDQGGPRAVTFVCLFP